jgi:DNA-binding transcriptional ArsR family regulator
MDSAEQVGLAEIRRIHLNVTDKRPRDSGRNRFKPHGSDEGGRRRWKVIEMNSSADVNNESEQEVEALFKEIKEKEFSREAEIFKALGHPIRLKIVYGLLKVGGCNVKNMQECLGLHQATVSQHLIHLKSRGIITSTRQGLEMVYKVNNSWAKCIVDNIEKHREEEDTETTQ